LRVALSIAVTVALALTVSATATFPGSLAVTTAPVGACCASAGTANTDKAIAADKIEIRMI
jgi:hypothetical protein